MIMFGKMPRAVAGEISHKLSVVADTPDLAESYGFSSMDVEALAHRFDNAARTDGAVSFDSGYAVMICEELDDAVLVMEDRLTGLDDKTRARARALIRECKKVSRQIRGREWLK